MPEEDRSVPPGSFEAKYNAHDDPWDYASSAYEQEKYRVALDALGGERNRSAFEIGCSIGVFTRMLAPLCDRLLAVDSAPTAVERARNRCAPLEHVQLELMHVPLQFPEETFDLVVLSEVGYYWSRKDLQITRRKILQHLTPSGRILLVHWTPPIDDAPLSGDEVHETVQAAANELVNVLHRREPTYRLDLLRKLPAN